MLHHSARIPLLAAMYALPIVMNRSIQPLQPRFPFHMPWNFIWWSFCIRHLSFCSRLFGNRSLFWTFRTGSKFQSGVLRRLRGWRTSFLVAVPIVTLSITSVEDFRLKNFLNHPRDDIGAWQVLRHLFRQRTAQEVCRRQPRSCLHTADPRFEDLQTAVKFFYYDCRSHHDKIYITTS